MSSALNNKNLEKLTKVVSDQLKKNMHQAFYDVLEAQVSKEEPDYKWLTNLYKEIRDKLTRLMRPTSALYKEIIETMDLELFEQMIRNKAFTPENMQNLVKNLQTSHLILRSVTRRNGQVILIGWVLPILNKVEKINI